MYRRPYKRREAVVRVPREGLRLEELYRAYYSLRPPIREPDNIERREFAFQYFGSDTYHRHLSFQSIDEVIDYMIENPPRQAYYSVAIYELPEAKSMEEKGWLGSDLFFDIDVDHLPGCNTILPTTECIMEGLRLALRIRAIARRDLGAEETHIYYTGHRGFHIVVDCGEECKTLGREERREIARYVSAEDLDLNVIFPEPRGRGLEPALPGEGEPGWRGWIAEALGGKSGGAVTVLGRGWREKILELVGELRVEIDHQVTQDPSRLLRLEGSLNGKASLLAVPVSEGWRPHIRDLSPFHGRVTVRCNSNIPQGDYLGFRGGLREGEEASLPAGVGVLLHTKGLCRVVEGEVVVRTGPSWRSI